LYCSEFSGPLNPPLRGLGGFKPDNLNWEIWAFPKPIARYDKTSKKIREDDEKIAVSGKERSLNQYSVKGRYFSFKEINLVY
jgi:hypothetical protein